MEVNKCIKCGCSDIDIGDCGYTSFNVAWAKCTQCDNKVKQNPYDWKDPIGQITNLWNESNRYLEGKDIVEFGFGISYGNKKEEMYSKDRMFLWYNYETKYCSIAISKDRDKDLNMPIVNDEHFVIRNLIIENKDQLKKLLELLKNNIND